MRNPIVHPPVAELHWVVQLIKYVHVHAMRKVMRQNLAIALIA